METKGRILILALTDIEIHASCLVGRESENCTKTSFIISFNELNTFASFIMGTTLRYP